MSFVTNIILTVGCLEEIGDTGQFPAVDHINRWLLAKGHGQFVQVDSYAGGKKFMEADVFLLAANYLDEGAFIEAIRTAQWEEPEALQLFLKAQEETCFREVRITRM